MHPLAWFLVATGWLLALVAWMLARRQSRRLAELTKMYWEVKYDCGELKARLRVLAPDGTDAPPPTSPAGPPQGFVALSDVRNRKA